MSDPVSGFLAALDLTDTGARTREDIFTGSSEWMPFGRVFGGQVLAQSLIAAARTVPEGRLAHSMHGYFLRPGDVDLPITFAVDRIHEGRSFTTRRTQAYQDGEPILSMIASFQVEDEGLDHQVEMPAGLPDPETLPSAVEAMGADTPAGSFWSSHRAFDVRHVTRPIYLEADPERIARQGVWMRAVGPMPDDPNLHRAAFAYASDYSILEPLFRVHGLSWTMRGLKTASLDHAMWWHRVGRADEWFLYTQEAPTSQGGRGLSLGRIFSRDGRLLASVAQEGMIRAPRAD